MVRSLEIKSSKDLRIIAALYRGSRQFEDSVPGFRHCSEQGPNLYPLQSPRTRLEVRSNGVKYVLNNKPVV